jgi:hypothetical protein
MAIIDCPSCNRKISNVTAICPYCGFRHGKVNEEQLRELKRRKLRDHVYHLNMISFTVIAMFLVAFGWYWWDTAGFQQPSSSGPVILLALGTFAYLVIRILLYRARRQIRRIAR